MRKQFYYFIMVMVGFTCIHFSMHAQVVTTVAGISSAGYAGDGGPATLATLRYPEGITVDSAGNIYVADNGNYRVRKISSSGVITTIAGTGIAGFSGDGGPATNARFSVTKDVAIDRIGNIYVADAGNNRLRKIDTSGIITTILGNGVNANTGDGGPAVLASTTGPCGVATDLAGNVYISTCGTIRKIDTFGIITTVAGTGVFGYTGDGGPATAADMGNIPDMALDKFGNIYIADRTFYRVRKVDALGIINTIAGTGIYGFSGDGGPATSAEFTEVEGVAADDAGNVYITDRDNYRFRKVNSLGVITTIAGIGTPGFTGDGGPATAAEFSYIGWLAKYGSGNIYVTDRNNQRIRMITDTNHAVTFTGPTSLLFNVCAPFISIDSLLTATDADTGEVDNWNLFYGPFHGSVTPTYATYTTGGAMLPTGLTYTPTPGYVGFDTFSVRVSDGYTSDTTTIYVRVDTTLPYAGGITGADSVCMGDTIMLADTITGGSWSVMGAHASVSSGVVTGITAGADTIRYIVTNACGADTAAHAVYIKACPDAVPFITAAANALHIYPSPNDGTFTLFLTSKTNEPAIIVITNTVGEKIAEYTAITNTVAHVYLSAPAGMYFISATTPSGRWNGRVVKQ